uniref:KIB1-4 beta-propeller domain-containing protein n=2 Tax=Oryza brachyantha TaxID=4533 RepID=J3NEM4_ORYBR
MAIPLPQLADAVLRARMKFKWDVYTKVILSSPPDSSMDPLIAALISEHHYVVISTCKHHDAISVGYDSNVPLADIAFLNGELYALTMKEGLYVYSPNNGCLGAPMNVSPGGFHQRITDAPKERELYYFLPGLLYVVSRYLAVCDGRLFMVRRWLSVPAHTRLGDEERTSWFEVLEADLTIAPCQWRRLHRLGGHAIFLGSKCTKFVRASQCVGGVQEDCIYFMHRIYDNQAREYWGLHADPLGDSGVYNMRTGAIKPLLPESRLAELPLKHQFPTWFFPTDL